MQSLTRSFYKGVFSNIILNKPWKQTFATTNLKLMKGLLSSKEITKDGSLKYNNAIFPTTFEDVHKEFMVTLPDVVQILRSEANNINADTKWLEEMFLYNLPSNELMAGFIVVSTFNSLVNKDNLTGEDIKCISHLGWCFELVFAGLLYIDDVMDGSVTRSGKHCWYKLERVGLRGVTHYTLFQAFALLLLKEKYGHSKLYMDMLQTLNQCNMIATCGQSKDMEIANRKITSFTMAEFENICYHKTAYCSVCLPALLAIRCARYKIDDPKIHDKISSIYKKIGFFWQCENDFIDAFGDPEISGKIGTDIMENKCTWLSLKCLERANKTQKDLMEKCYGQYDSEKVELIKNLYQDLNIPEAFADFRKCLWQDISTRIEEVSTAVPICVFENILNVVRKRYAM